MGPSVVSNYTAVKALPVPCLEIGTELAAE